MGGDLLALLAFPALAATIFVGIHTWLGLQVLRRNVVFADLALAQLAALGGTIAIALGHAPNGPGGFAYALVATLLGAVLLTASRRLSLQVSQEAIIGVLYVVATALTVLVVDRSPQGAEHVKRMLVGSILTVGPADVVKLLLLYGAIGTLHAHSGVRLFGAVGFRFLRQLRRRRDKLGRACGRAPRVLLSHHPGGDRDAVHRTHRRGPGDWLERRHSRERGGFRRFRPVGSADRSRSGGGLWRCPRPRVAVALLGG